MLRHNLLLFFRNLKKDRKTFLINITGLSTGLACVLFIYLWVSDETAMDKFHETDAHLYQLMSNYSDASGIHTWNGVPGLLLEEIQTAIPEVSHVVASTGIETFTLAIDKTVLKSKGKFVSEDFFDVFSYPLAKGDLKTALSKKTGIVITEALAQRLFKSTDVIGRTVDWSIADTSQMLEVTGVMKNLPSHTSDKFDFVMSWNYYHDDLISYKNWDNYYGRIALVTHKNTDVKAVSSKIDAIFKAKSNNANVSLFLTKYSDQYLHNVYEGGKVSGGRIAYVTLFSIVALFVLCIACINFINLSTAKASHRAKEIGTKKTFGASRKSLIGQYFIESILLSAFSLLLAVFLVFIFLPQFNALTAKDLSLNFTGSFLMFLIGVVVVVGLLSGSYPALYLSRFNVIKAMKGAVSSTRKDEWRRQTLVVTQFTLSIILIVAVIVIDAQMEYIHTKNLGFNNDNVIYFERDGRLRTQTEQFIAALKNEEGIKAVSHSSFAFGGNSTTGGVHWPGKTEKDRVQFWEIKSGYGSLNLLDFELLEGRDFSNSFASDKNGVIVNETAVAAMGMTHPIGKTIRHYSGKKQIVGVVKDFNLTSLHTEIEPVIFLCKPQSTDFILVKLNNGMTSKAIARVQELYSKFNPNAPFKFKFLDEDYQALYTSETRVANLSMCFAGLAILISCLGLLGLAAYTAETRKKEIGIRKVLGSSAFAIIKMLTSDFSKMVIVAICIALPISYLFSKNWLDAFAYRIELKWWYFISAGLLALVISWLTVGFQTFKAAVANPIKSLRTE
jgi:ABC-type antimicrobial peptide transport system permease subunit